MCVKETAGKASHGEARTAEAPKTRKMSFVSDRLYNGYLRRNMSTIVSKVKVREIMIHLPCLTPHDRENIEAKRETNGNFDSMVLLLDCLKRRENWPQQFIDALEACEQTSLAAEIRAEYDALRGVANSGSSSLPATVVRAHVHAAPPAGPPSVPEGGANSQAAAADAAPPAPAEPTPQAQLPEAVSPPEPVTAAPQAARRSTPPTSPEPRRSEATATPPQGEVNAGREPEENSESDIQDVPGDNGVTPDRERAETGEVSMERAAAPPPGRCETDTPSLPDTPQTTTTSAQVGPPPSPSPTQVDSDVTDASSSPVQDTGARVDLNPAVVLQPEERFEAAATRVVESNPGTEVAAATPPLPGADGSDAALRDDDVCLSKPGQLVSIHPANGGRPTASAHAPPTQPYSGDSGRLEFSDATTEPSSVDPPPGRAAFAASAAAPCQENGVPLGRNEPAENHYKSRSSEGPEVSTHVVHVSEEAPVLDLDGQSPAPARVVSVPFAPPACSARNSPSIEARDPSGPAGISPRLKTPQHSEKKTSAQAKYFVAAAGVAAFALLLAWRFKN
ncbi:LOW QUALITY PROTEIN: mitochondrial antiviral-signaling protein [Spinachia spinachia]